MEYSKLLQTILDIAEEMLVAGAEVSRVEDSIYRMCTAYGCRDDRSNAFIITSNIQVTVEAPDGEIITQIRRVIRSDANYDRLDYLNDLSRKICENTPDLETVRKMYEEVMSRPKHKPIVDVIAHFLIAGGFAIFFGGSPFDGVAGGILGIAVWLITKKMSRNDANPLARAFVTSIICGAIAVGFSIMGLHVDKIMIGGIMLLIPGIALTNSIRDMLIGDIATGLLRFFNSLLVAVSIACGFGLSLYILGGNLNGTTAFNYGEYENIVQVVSAFFGSLGFTLFFNMKGKQVWYAATAGAITWGVYLLANMYLSGDFVPNLIAAVFVGIIADALARINRAPATIFLTAAAVPLIPGASLYYAMEALVKENPEQFSLYGERCVIIALAIALGFMVVAIIQKYTRYGLFKR